LREPADECDVPHEIEDEIGVPRGFDSIRAANLQKRIAIGGCIYARLGGDGAGSARSVLDYELLAQPVRQPLSHQACGDVGGSASRKADDNADRPRRIGLRPCYPRYGRQRGSARGQMQKISAVKFHSTPPEFQPTVSRNHSGLMFAARTTLPHFSVSSAISLPKSAGEPASGLPPRSASRALILWSTRPALISMLSFSMTSMGVFFGGSKPNQRNDSKPGKKSLSTGKSGSASDRVVVVTASARIFPA